jgi:hypothetical protein
MLLTDDKGELRLIAGVTKSNIPVFALATSGKPKLRAMVDGEGTPSLQFLDDKQNTTWEAK